MEEIIGGVFQLESGEEPAEDEIRVGGQTYRRFQKFPEVSGTFPRISWPGLMLFYQVMSVPHNDYAIRSGKWRPIEQSAVDDELYLDPR